MITSNKNGKSKKINLQEFIWYGFNYTVGITFLSILQLVSNPDIGVENKGSYGLGLYILISFIFSGIIATICAWGFIKLSKVHSSNVNGGAYIYARSAFGRLSGFIVAFLQYVSLPFLITFEIMTTMRGTFDAHYNGNSVFSLNLGAFTDLYLDLIGIVIYMSAVASVFFGMRIYKKFASFSGIIKWITAVTLIISGIILAFMHGKENYNTWITGSGIHFTFKGFLKSFIAIFFFFTGFEVFITSTKNIANPNKTIPKGLLILMVIVVLFYVSIIILWFAATPYLHFSQNPLVSTWKEFNINAIIWIGASLMFVSQLSMKINVAMLNGFYGGIMLQPLSEEGYISEKFKALNKDDMPYKASLLNIIVTFFMIFLWLIIPDLIDGILLFKNKNVQHIPFNVGLFTSAQGVICLILYLTVLVICLKYHFTDNKKNSFTLKIWEISIFMFAILIIIFLIFYHYFALIADILTFIKDNLQLSLLINSLVEIVFTLSVIISAFSIYYIYYIPNYKKRLKINPELQKQLDEQFKILSAV